MSITPGTQTTVLRLGLAGVGSLVGVGVMYAELQQARKAIPVRTEAPRADGFFGPVEGGRPLRLAMIGDSSASGVGCDTDAQTPGALLALGLVELGYRVSLEVFAVSGSRSADLAPQVSRALLAPPDVAVICVGANDVTHFIPADTAAPMLGEAVRRLRDEGVAVLVATCPDLGSVRPVPQPLRKVGHHLSRRMARLQTRAVLEAGGLPVDVGRQLGRTFARQGDELFSPDRFHPSPSGYRALVETLLGPLETLLPR